ncbi:MAG TPA: hypothetical protein VMF08_14825 [Candidatus Sulfotelmatobacter sp.]|nr:hypothetical protein [Candidatus Sulfotelmatobacter sp.]
MRLTMICLVVLAFVTDAARADNFTNQNAASSVTIALDTKNPGAVIPPDFSGLSFEMSQLLPDENGNHYFSPKNKPLVRLFKTLGIKSLRAGGNTADKPTVKIPDEADIDSLFAFARAAGVKVIYTVRLRQGDPQADAAIAKYILDHYKSRLTCIAIGNEPNFYFKDYSAYRNGWKQFMETISTASPDVRFCGPGAGPTAWLRGFTTNFGDSGRLVFIAAHVYFAGDGHNVPDPAKARDKILSAEFLKLYENYWRAFVPTVLSHGLPYRLEEANNFYNGGARDVSDTYAAALWGLDFMHWWAAHDAAGINFHTGDNVAAGQQITPCRYAAYLSVSNGYAAQPLGYGIKAFSLGGRGRIVPATITGNDGLNLTAYGAQDGKDLSLTIINKEHGDGARDIDAIIAPATKFAAGRMMLLTAPNGDVSVKTGETLGGAPIGFDGSWNGEWMPLAAPKDGRFIINIPAAAAAIVKLR